ncbi:antitoxin Xre-like helix-turn-helix domain-containing protein [Pacificimonas sp. ICDLI1SI03]
MNILDLERPGIDPIADREQVSIIVKAVVRATRQWHLSGQEAAALFDVPQATWDRMKQDTFKGRLDRDKVTRASLIIGIFKGLRLLFNGPLTTSWPTLANKGAPYSGRRPVDMMIAGGIPAMIAVRQHLDALRGGV